MSSVDPVQAVAEARALVLAEYGECVRDGDDKVCDAGHSEGYLDEGDTHCDQFESWVTGAVLALSARPAIEREAEAAALRKVESCAVASGWPDEDELRAEIRRLRETIAEHESSITWDTTCLNCASLLDQNYADFVRAERAEATLADLEAVVRAQHTPVTETIQDHGGMDTVTYCQGCGTDLDEQDCPYLAALGEAS
ncbi:hypothetical protein [Ornithinimicrobium murale]|uniref:hypothetical protein n=1 Tax=Ornithinimicrobium murale TaxID=1050153 RepID=UPI000E0D32CE|nr:hypothetical protein [Ornithinimicrobium murale]